MISCNKQRYMLPQSEVVNMACQVKEAVIPLWGRGFLKGYTWSDMSGVEPFQFKRAADTLERISKISSLEESWRTARVV